MSAWRWVEVASQDVRFALRQLRRHPVFATTAVLTLGLGIGANTAVFTAVRGVLLRPLPYAHPEQLVALNTRYLPISGFDIARFPISPLELTEYREENTSLVGAEPYSPRTTTLGGDAVRQPSEVSTALVSAGLFPLLGVRPMLGAGISAEDDVPGAPPVAVLSYSLWVTRFGADPSIVGQSVTLGGRPARVTGVMPEGFGFPTGREQLWGQLALDWSQAGRGQHFLGAVGRLGPGVSLSSARAEMATIAERWAQVYPHNVGHFVIAEDLARDMVGDVGHTLLLLQLAVGLVLLVACANLANLSLARAEGRRHELAVRTSLGAGRGRLTRQLLTEALVLAVLGAALGWILGTKGSALLTAIDPGALPRGEAIRTDGTVLLFTVLSAVGAALMFGTLPAWRATRGRSSGKPGFAERGMTSIGSHRIQKGLVAAEVALSVVVVAAAGLITRSVQETLRVDLGMRTEGLVTARVPLAAGDYPDDAQVESFFAALEERLAAVPGVVGVSGVSALPLGGSVGRFDFVIEGRAPQRQGDRVWNAWVASARPGYFETAGIPVFSGRTVLRSDRGDAEPIVWISQRCAALFWPGEDPVGALIRFSGSPEATRFRVAGVVGDTRAQSLRQDPDPQLYFAHAQMGLMGGVPRTMNLVVRTSLPGAAVIPALRATIREQDARLAAPDVLPMERVVVRSAARPRLTAALLACFGILALVLAGLGVYGVTSYAVASRTREIGIRVALGAGRGVISRSMLAQGLTPALYGLAVGLAGAIVLMPRLNDLLFRVSPRDPLTLIAISGSLVLAAVLASWIPTRRALRIPATQALRE